MENEFLDMADVPAVSGLVLVVDDENTARTLHRTALSSRFDVVSASSGEETLQLCHERLPDLVLLDVMMPGMDGYETCRRLREFTDIPIIFATANESLDEHLKAFDAGGDDIITKPVVREILLRKAALAIQRKNERQSLRSEKDNLQSMAMNFLSAVGESGVLQKFMQASLTSSTSKELGRHLVEAIRDFGLECSVLIRDQASSTTLTSQGEPSAIEISILEQSASMGRIFQFRHKLVVNYDRVSVIVNNMPADDADKSGRIRDNVAMLAEMTDTLCENVDMRQASMSRAEQLQVALGAAVMAIEALHEKNRNAQSDTRLLLQELVDNIEKSYSWLGTSRDQEARISQTMYGSVEKILQLLESSSVQSDEEIEKILSALRGGHVGGEVDLF